MSAGARKIEERRFKMKVKAIMATTHVDRHNMKITKEALESGVRQINGDYALVFNLEHDVTLPPIGKVIEAGIEQLEDGEYQLVATNEVFENLKEIKMPDGVTLLEQESSTDHRPFIGSEMQTTDEIEIHYDMVNFESKQKLNQFIQDLKSVADFKERTIARKAFIPDPQLIITFTSGIIAYLTGQKVVEKVADKLIDPVLDDVAKLYPLIKSAISGMLRYAIPKNRPITYVFLAPGQPTIEFVARTNNPDLVMSAVLQENIKESFSKAEELRQTVQAVKVQFLLNADGNWTFNYLLTNIGKVIGTPESYSRRARVLELMSSNDVTGTGEVTWFS